MVGASDFLAAPPLNEFAHFVIGLIAVAAALLLMRFGRYPWGITLLAGFVLFVGIKEFWIDETTSCWGFLCGYGQSANGASVDATFYLVGGSVGAAAGVVLPSPPAIGAALASTAVVGLLLLAGAI